MKKLLTLMFLGLALTSCEISDNDDWARRHEDRIWSVTNELYCNYGLGNIEGMEACIKIDDYIKADNEGKKNSRFSDIGYFATDDRYEIGNYYEVYPDGKSILETGAVWECLNGFQYQDRMRRGERMGHHPFPEDYRAGLYLFIYETRKHKIFGPCDSCFQRSILVLQMGIQRGRHLYRRFDLLRQIQCR